MTDSRTILVVDDEPSILRMMQDILEASGYRVKTAANGKECLDRLESGGFPDLIFLDLLMPGMDGLETLERIRKMRPNTNVVMLSCMTDTAKVVQAMRLGAKDYLTKPFEQETMDEVLARFLAPEHSDENALPCEIDVIEDGLFFLAGTEEMKKIRADIGLIANVDIPVLILGESGSGKEVIARLIHKNSSRANRPFLKVNCAALPGHLLESELFGYEAGAFTGAVKAKPGKFEQCDGGTLLLDEIGEMPAALQAKLLHVLQDGSFSRLGGRKNIRVDVRILAATNVDVQKAIVAKTFREDLFYRLNAFTVNVPPLRERRAEVPMLLRNLMNQVAESYGRPPMPFTPRVVQACMEAQWPGNVRELENFVKRYLILGDEDLALQELAAMEQAGSSAAWRDGAPGDSAPPQPAVRGDGESEVIQRALQQHGWDRRRAAAALGMTPNALLGKIRRYKLRPPKSPPRLMERDYS